MSGTRVNNLKFKPSLQYFFSKLSTQPNKNVLLLGETDKSCKGVRLFLEQNRIDYKLVTERTLKDFDKKYLYGQNEIPNFASIVFCSFRNFLQL